MVRRILLLGVLGLGGLSAAGCANRPLFHRPCGSPILSLRRPLLAPAAMPVEAAPIGYGDHGDAPLSGPACSSCAHGGGGMPLGAAPVDFSHGPPAGVMYGPPNYAGSSIPHDSMLLPNPTVIPPGAGSPRIEIDPPKIMAK